MKCCKRILVMAMALSIVSCIPAHVIRNELLDYPDKPGIVLKQPPADMANVIFFRPLLKGNLYATAIYDDERFVSLQTSHTHTQYLTTPGKHQFMVSVFSDYPDFLDAELEGGKIYIVKIEFINKALIGVWPEAGVKLLPVKPGTEDWRQLKTWLAQSYEVYPTSRSRKWAEERHGSVLRKKKKVLPKWEKWEGRLFLKSEYGVSKLE